MTQTNLQKGDSRHLLETPIARFEARVQKQILEDGLFEILMGAAMPLGGLGFFLLSFYGVHLAFAPALLILLMPLAIRLHRPLQKRLVFPRTGYFRPARLTDPERTRNRIWVGIALSLSILVAVISLADWSRYINQYDFWLVWSLAPFFLMSIAVLWTAVIHRTLRF